jgi:regulator of protease activity HflC (stomatin/prohibitin superfamily)
MEPEWRADVPFRTIVHEDGTIERWQQIQDVLDKQTEGWGIKVSTVELKRIDLEPSMIRAIARQAEAERERRAKIINAEGEQQAAQKLVDAARILADVPQAMQLRYLGTLFDIAGDRTSMIVFPFPNNRPSEGVGLKYDMAGTVQAMCSFDMRPRVTSSRHIVRS